jgi:UDP-2,4-diacetamido-2,4,6-trideoxy-beta-L-altropyranose hydrolase
MTRSVVAIRADSSAGIGSGHVMRCLTLALELRRRGHAVEFVCRDHQGNWTAQIESEGFPVHRLPAPARDAGPADSYAAWLGVSQQQDADETRIALSGRSVDWLIVDHYGLDRGWESTLRSTAARILVVDDIANRPHDCDVLLDQNYCGHDTAARYDGLVVASTVRLLGPGYALLRPEYRELRAMLPPRDGHIGRVVIFFGGGDPADSTSRVIEALSCAALGHLAVDVVLGANHCDPARVRALAAARPLTRVLAPLPSLAGVLARVDLAIGAGGSTTWERACLALPAVVATIADNQKPFTEALAADGYQLSMGDAATTTAAEWRERIIAVVRTPAITADLGARIGTLVDGWGAGRVCSHLSARGENATVGQLIVHDARSRAVVADAHGLPLGALTFDDRPAGTDRKVTAEQDPLLPDGLSETLLRAAVEHHRNAGPFLRTAVGGRTAPANSPLRITLLSDATSWINARLTDFAVELLQSGHRVRWIHETARLLPGDVCVILSFGAILSPEALAEHRHNLVVHESALPLGKGWSPMTWQIIDGQNRIPVTLFEAEAGVDAGPIYLQRDVALTGAELIDEWRRMQADVSVELVREWLARFPNIVAERRPQAGTVTFYARRRPEHSRLEPSRTVAEQFNLMRVVDNDRYPAWFEMHGRRFRIAISEFE